MLMDFLLHHNPGTLSERGLLTWLDHIRTVKLTHHDRENLRCYDFPFGMTYLRKWSWTSKLPFCPMYRGVACCSRPQKGSSDTESVT